MIDINFSEILDSFFSTQADIVEQYYCHLAPHGGMPRYPTNKLQAAYSQDMFRLIEDVALDHYDIVQAQQERYWLHGVGLALAKHRTPTATLENLLAADELLTSLRTLTLQQLTQSILAADTSSPLFFPQGDARQNYVDHIYTRGAAQLGTFVLVGYCWAAALLQRFGSPLDDAFTSALFTAFRPQ